MPKLLAQIDEKILRRRDVGCVNAADPMPALRERGHAVPVGRGLFVLAGPLVRLMRAIDRRLVDFATGLGCEEMIVPSMLSEETTRRSGYVDSFARQAMRLSAPGVEGLRIACPTVCHHYFALLRGSTAPRPALVTARASCARHEEGELDDLGRLESFTMREIVGIGDRAHCAQMIDRIERSVTEILEITLDLAYVVSTASDPFFGDASDLKKKAQLMDASKTEIRALLPHRGSHLPIVSLNRHAGTFVSRFDLRGLSDRAETFCVGFGYERIAFAIVSQKGVDFDSPYYRRLFSHG